MPEEYAHADVAPLVQYMVPPQGQPYGERENPWEGSEARATTSVKTMAVQFADHTVEPIPQGTIHYNAESGWTTVVTDQDEIVLTAPTRLIEKFSIAPPHNLGGPTYSGEPH